MAALGLIEISGFSPAMVALDVMTKAAQISLLQVELNDLYGTCVKLTGKTAAVAAALQAGRSVAQRMHVQCVARVINSPDAGAGPAYAAPPEFSPLIEQDVVHTPRFSKQQQEQSAMSEQVPYAIGMIETQGLTAVIEAIDTACKAGNVEILGREKLGGGYITVLLKGDVAAVQAAIDAGRARLEALQLGKLIACHVIARPSAQVIALLSAAR